MTVISTSKANDQYEELESGRPNIIEVQVENDGYNPIVVSGGNLIVNVMRVMMKMIF